MAHDVVALGPFIVFNTCNANLYEMLLKKCTSSWKDVCGDGCDRGNVKFFLEYLHRAHSNEKDKAETVLKNKERGKCGGSGCVLQPLNVKGKPCTENMRQMLTDVRNCCLTGGGGDDVGKAGEGGGAAARKYDNFEGKDEEAEGVVRWR